jgi:RHS repeat-associated protein
LVREDNVRLGTTTVWDYDDAGNILSVLKYPYTAAENDVDSTIQPEVSTYAYNDSNWGDLLTAYNNVSWTYDQIGNLTNDGTWNYTWQNGRELASMSAGSTAWNFTYDANGMRTSRSNGSTTYSYVYNGDQLVQMTKGTNTLYFTYGAFGPNSVTWNGTTYYYAVNAQGDVTGIFDGAGNCVVTYSWDTAWGYNPTPSGSMASTLGTLNPLRYRGYVYDQETGLYYLQSRYYNPQICRFINADNYPTTGQGLTGNNMFAYCGNNPVSREDDGGEFWHIVVGAAVGAAVSFASSVVGDLIAGEKVDWAGAGISAAFGAVSGALAATGLGPVVQIAGGAVMAGAENVIEQGREKGFDNINYGEVAFQAAVGGFSSRTNGLSKATVNHLNKQAAVATKRISNSFKHDTLRDIGKTVIKAGKYYLSQTKTIFYKPLLDDATESFWGSVKQSFI